MTRTDCIIVDKSSRGKATLFGQWHGNGKMVNILFRWRIAGGTSELVSLRAGVLHRFAFLHADSLKFSNLGFSYVQFINHDRAHRDQLRGERRETRRTLASLSPSRISRVSLLLTSSRRLMSGYQRGVVLPTSSLPTRARGGSRDQRETERTETADGGGGGRESEKDREEGERGSIVSDAGRGARSMPGSACFHAC